jgi:LacI family transcriptional regulator
MELIRQHSTVQSLAVHGTEVARYQSGTGLALQQAPRPFLHPVRTLNGTMVSDAEPPDHRHHLGLSLAISDLGGTNYWGGSTYVPGSGPAMLPNHGRQVVVSSRSSADSITETIHWSARDGTVDAVETRSLRVSAHPDRRCWSLSLTSRLAPCADTAELRLSSSAVKGRKGAGYGGIFWRLPRDSRADVVLTESGAGTEAAHGSRSPWLSIAAVVAGKPASLVLAQGPALPRTTTAPAEATAPDAEQALPWFVRTDGYLGAGPAVAWDRIRPVDAARPLELSLHAVVMDGTVDTPELARKLLCQHPAFAHTQIFDRTA